MGGQKSVSASAGNDTDGDGDGSDGLLGKIVCHQKVFIGWGVQNFTGGGVYWAQTLLTQSLPDLHIFKVFFTGQVWNG